MNEFTFKQGDKGLTRDGRPFVVVAETNKDKSNHLIHAVVTSKSGTEGVVCFFSNGRTNRLSESAADLMPPTYERFVNIYKDGSIFYHEDEKSAKVGATTNGAADGKPSADVVVFAQKVTCLVVPKDHF